MTAMMVKLRLEKNGYIWYRRTRLDVCL